MAALRFIFFKDANFVRFNQENIRAEANTLMVFRDAFDVLMSGEFIEITCSMQQLLDVCNNLCEHFVDYNSCYERHSYRALDFPASAQKTLFFFLGTDKCRAVANVIHYCLSKDWDYFSEMFTSLINEGGELIGFMKEYAFNPWPVERYANILGISLRKFNFVFKERFGMSPKHWLIETRLVHARYLLSYTTMPISVIASHCGFNNHAYFSECFRKRFSCSPSQFRTHPLLNLNQLDREVNHYES